MRRQAAAKLPLRGCQCAAHPRSKVAVTQTESSRLRSEAGCAKPRLPSLESLPSFFTGCGSKAPNSSGHQRRLLINLHSRTAEFPPTSGNQRPCRDAGVGAIAPGSAMLKRANALHTLIRQRHLTPSCGGQVPTAERTLDPARMLRESLTPGPELENSQGHSLPGRASSKPGHVSYVPIATKFCSAEK